MVQELHHAAVAHRLGYEVSALRIGHRYMVVANTNTSIMSGRRSS